jgi:hypothetical protein
MHSFISHLIRARNRIHQFYPYWLLHFATVCPRYWVMNVCDILVCLLLGCRKNKIGRTFQEFADAANTTKHGTLTRQLQCCLVTFFTFIVILF